MHAHFLHPFTMTVSGSTGSGKSEWIQRLLSALEKGVCAPPPQAVAYCYGELNPLVLRMQREQRSHADGGKRSPASPPTHQLLLLYQGCPSEEQVQQWAQRAEGRLLLILDDLVGSIQPTFLDTLFTRGSHNWGVSVVLVTQHLFNRELRVARNNSHYIVLMRNPAGALQVRNLATQLFPGRHAHFMEAYADATRQRYGYLLIDMHPATDEEATGRLKTHIYPEEGDHGFPIVYMAK